MKKIKEDWKEVKIDDLGEINRGRSRHRPRNADFLYGDKYPFVQTADVKAAEYRINSYSQMYSKAGLEQSKLWPKDTLCITIAANIADAALLGFDACFPDSIVGFNSDPEKSDVRFVKYLFDLMQIRIKQISQGAAQDNLSLNKIRTLDFLVPPLKTQQKIASVLSAYDDLIENNLKRIQVLEEMAQQTYEEWFVRMKYPGHKEDTINEETGLPEGWERVKFKKEFTINNGYAFQSAEYSDDGIQLIRTRDYSTSKWVEVQDQIYIKQNERYDKYLIKSWDLLVIMVGASIGKYGVALPKDKDKYLNQNQWAIRAKNTNYEFYKILLIENIIIELTQLRTGAARDFFRKAFLENIDIDLPDNDLIVKFNELVEPIFININNLHIQNQQLRESRDILLPRLMMGLVDVEDIV